MCKVSFSSGRNNTASRPLADALLALVMSRPDSIAHAPGGILVTLVTLCVALAGFATPAMADNYIVGGHDAAICQWPTAVLVEIGRSTCSGTLIAPTVVVYAAHCGSQVDRVVFGEQSPGAYAVGVARCEVHPDFDESAGIEGYRGKDYAYCILERPVNDVPLVPALFGCEAAAIEEGAPVTVVGFGNNVGGPGDPGLGVKRMVDVTINAIDPAGEIVVGGDGRGACHGDSGGPLWIQLPQHVDPTQSWRLLAVSSRGADDCNGISYYGRMDAQRGLPWLENATGLDLTPCFSIQGEWEPGPACAGFAEQPDAALGTWETGCDHGRRDYTHSCAGLDHQPPTIKVLTPRNFLEVPAGESLTVQAEITDDFGIARAALRVNDEELDTLSQAPWIWNFVVEDQDMYVLEVHAKDVGNNWARSVKIQVFGGEPPSDDTTTEASSESEPKKEGFLGLGCQLAGQSIPSKRPTWLALSLGILFFTRLRRDRGFRRRLPHP